MVQTSRWKRRFDNYTSAVQLLKRVAPTGEVSEVVGLATVRAFKIVVELGWRLLADYLRAQGIEHERTPKTTIREAFNIEIIEDEQLWMDLVQARNKTSHVCRSEVVEIVVRDIVEKYLPAFEQLATTFARIDDA